MQPGVKRGREFGDDAICTGIQKAKSGREEDIATFLVNARELVMAEVGTVTWFSIRFDNAMFAIFDAFNDEAGRDAHFNGAIAAGLTTMQTSFLLRRLKSAGLRWAPGELPS